MTSVKRQYYKTPSADELTEAAACSLKSMSSLLENPLNDSHILVAETEVVIQGREAMGQ